MKKIKTKYRLITPLVLMLLFIATFSCNEDDTILEKHIVTMDSNGGTNFAPIDVPNGELLPPNKLYPDPIVSDGGTFEYWTIDQATEIPFDFNSPITEPMNLYAKWFYVTITIKFEMNGSTPMDDVQVRVGKFLERPEDPVRDGFIFVNWYQDADFTKVFNFNGAISEDATLYVRWLQLSPESWFTVTSEGLLTGCVPDPGTQVVVIPEVIGGVTVKGIGDWFVLANGITFVEEFIFPESLETIGTGSFKSSGIVAVTIPPMVKVLVATSFLECNQLTSFNFAPNSTLEKLEDNAGSESVIGSTSLKTISFPPSLKFVGKYTLGASQSLLQVTFERSVSPIVFYSYLPGGGHWLFGGYHPPVIRMPNIVKDAFFELNKPVMNPWEFGQWQAVVVGY